MQAVAAEFSGYAGAIRCLQTEKSFKQCVSLQYRSNFPPKPLRERLLERGSLTSFLAREIFALEAKNPSWFEHFEPLVTLR
jgi:hypothetical protein